MAAALLCLGASGQTAPQDPGHLIYNKGESPVHEPVEAVLGDTTVPATLMPCASCHGADGKGRAEGGVVPSDITWNVLTRPRNTDTALGRRRPAYDERSLRKVMREGIDPAGNELGIVMPRYKMSDGDLDHLIGFLRQLGVKSDPGVTPTLIRAATVVPATGPLAESGTASIDLMRAYFEELNQQGGFYGRKIELQVIQTRATPWETAMAVEEFVREHEVFALTGVLAPGAERQLTDTLESAGIPTVGTFPTDGNARLLTKAKVFHVLSGLQAQTQALVRFAQEHLGDSGASLVVAAPEDKRNLAAIVLEECRRRSWNVQQLNYTNFDAGKIAAMLSADKPQGVIFLGQGNEMAALLAAAERLQWRPQIFQPGLLAGDAVFHLSPEASDRVFFSFASLPTDISQEAMAEYKFLVTKYKLKPVHPARALTTLAAAKVFVEGLRQQGRELTRDGFVDSLAALYNFHTGLTPPVTYGSTRRIGALGAYVVRLDTKTNTLKAAAAWIETTQ